MYERCRYEVNSEGAQADLPLHQDGSLVSFNVLLNPASVRKRKRKTQRQHTTAQNTQQNDVAALCQGRVSQLVSWHAAENDHLPSQAPEQT